MGKVVVCVALTERQAAFVREYLVDLNAAAAARRAGYSEKTARAIGAENLTKPDIVAALQEEMLKRSKRTEITADRVLAEYAKIAFFDIRKLLDDEGNPKPIGELDDDAAAAISGLDVAKMAVDGTDVETSVIKYKLADKIKALDSIAKHLGMDAPQKLEVSANVSATVSNMSVADKMELIRQMREGNIDG